MKILLIDDHPIFRAGLELLLRQLDPEAEVFHAGNCADGIGMAREQPLHLVFLDLQLPDGDGLDCLRILKETRPGLPVVIVSGQEVDRTLVERALDLRAMGFVPKSENPDMIGAALRAALAGGVFLPMSLFGQPKTQAAETWDRQRQFVPPAIAASSERANYSLPPPCKPEDLGITPRQTDVLRLLVQGMPNKRIATRLGISVPVVKKHVSDLLAHFHVVSRTQLVASIAQRELYFGPPGLSDPREEVAPDGD